MPKPSFCWAKIYGEWTIVEIVYPNPDKSLGLEFYCIGDDQLHTVDDFRVEDEFKVPGPPKFEWGEKIELPESIDG